MQITDVRVRKIASQNRMKAIASITFDDVFVVHDIRILESDKGLFIAMPSRTAPNGEHKDIAHPLNTETRKTIESAIIAKYNETQDSEVVEATK
jgi:stage V sporulation protein G